METRTLSSPEIDELLKALFQVQQEGTSLATDSEVNTGKYSHKFASLRATLREAVPDRIATGRGSIRPRITASPASPSIPGMS